MADQKWAAHARGRFIVATAPPTGIAGAVRGSRSRQRLFISRIGLGRAFGATRNTAERRRIERPQVFPAPSLKFMGSSAEVSAGALRHTYKRRILCMLEGVAVVHPLYLNT